MSADNATLSAQVKKLNITDDTVSASIPIHATAISMRVSIVGRQTHMLILYIPVGL